MNRLAGMLLGAVMAALSAGAAAAEPYPEQPLKLVVPWAAGGDTDLIFRPIAPLLQKHLGKPVQIANVLGGGGVVGARDAKKSPPDGYTLFGMHDYLHLAYYTGAADVNYTDLEPVCALAVTPSVLAASEKAPFADLAQLFEVAGQRPGQITAGAMPGTTSHVLMALLEKQTGIKLKYVSYDSLGARMGAILANQVDIADSSLTLKPKVEAKQMRFLAIAAEQRSTDMPGLPTFKELGVDLVYEVVRGLMAPRGLVAEVKAKLGEACALAAADPAYSAAMAKQGSRVHYLNAKDYLAYLQKVDADYKALLGELKLLKRQ